MELVGEAVSDVIMSLRQSYMERIRALPCFNGVQAVECDGDGHRQVPLCAYHEIPICPIVVRETNRRLMEEDPHLGSRAGSQLQTEAEHCGIPVRHWHLFDVKGGPARKFRDTDAMAAMEKYGEKADIVILSGGEGCGKSGAAALWCWKHRGFFTTAPEVMATSAYDQQGMERLRRPRHLVIDELGVEHSDAKGVWRSKLSMLLGMRYNDCSKTVITTNLTPEQISALLGERMMARIHESGRIARCSGESLRCQPGHMKVEG